MNLKKKLLLGHPFHPYPKFKSNMSNEDIKQYAPEFSGHFKLLWIKVSPKQVASNLDENQLRISLKPLVDFDLKVKKDNELYIPMHPWQWNNIKNKELVDLGSVEVIGEGEHAFWSLSSLRSTFCVDAPLLPKFSMDVEITNSIRHLHLNESLRGDQINQVLNKKNINEKITILKEPFFCCLVGKSNNPVEDTIIQFRENFSSEFDLSQTFLLSTLCEIHPSTNVSMIDKQIESIANKNQSNIILARKIWFDSFLEKCLKPILTLALEDGVLLGAHMQNLIINIINSRPNTVVFRDCQGTGFTLDGYQKYTDEIKSLDINNGNILSEEDMNKVFGYYVIINTIFTTISSITHSCRDIEYQLLNDFRTFIYNLNSQYKNHFLDYILNSKFLYQKGNARCTLLGLNESTVDNPWKIYNKIYNPIKNLRPVDEIKAGTVYKARTKKNVNISFRVLEEADLDLFYDWHHKEFISEFWELNVSKSELLNYIKKIKSSSYQLPLIFEVEGEPVGYFEVYWAYDDRIAPYCDPKIYDRGVHLLIAQEKYLRTRIVYDALKHVSKFLFEENSKTENVYGEPRSDNKKIIKFAHKLPGWEFKKIFNFPHKEAALLECNRERFFKEYGDSL